MYLLDCLGKFLGLETTRTFSFLRILKTKYQGHICFIAESGSSKIKGSFTLHRTLLRADLYSVPSKHGRAIGIVALQEHHIWSLVNGFSMSFPTIPWHLSETITWLFAIFFITVTAQKPHLPQK